jgi:hypothetical protein
MFKHVVCALTASLLFAAAASGQTPAAEQDTLRVELRRLREEFDQVRQQYTERHNALERRLAALDQSGIEIPPASPPALASCGHASRHRQSDCCIACSRECERPFEDLQSRPGSYR